MAETKNKGRAYSNKIRPEFVKAIRTLIKELKEALIVGEVDWMEVAFEDYQVPSGNTYMVTFEPTGWIRVTVRYRPGRKSKVKSASRR